MSKMFFRLSLILFLFGVSVHAGTPPLPADYDLSVSFDIPASLVSGLAVIQADAGKTMTFDTRNLTVTEITLNGKPVAYDAGDGGLTVTAGERGVLSLRYKAVFGSKEAPIGEAGGTVLNTIAPGSVFLTGVWYPKPEQPMRYRLRAKLPNGYEALSEAEQIEKTGEGDSTRFLFTFEHRLHGLSLAASDRYEIVADRFGSVDLYAYFDRKDRRVAAKCLEQAKKFIGLYEKLLGQFPYKRFSVIQTFLPSGRSLPTFTLLGRETPLISETRLARAVVHQWFGSSVSPGPDSGNWAEGLAVYLSDHLYEERAGRGAEYRKRLLLEYEAAVNEQNEISLREFKERTDRASRAIGQGKAAMVFHMLKKSLGEEAFFEGLRSLLAARRHRTASWDDVRTAFEQAGGSDLKDFFVQWVDRKGLPEPAVDDASVKRKGRLFRISFEARQKEPVFDLDLPVIIECREGNSRKEKLKLDAEKKRFTAELDAEPRTVRVDPDYDGARRLADPELPPVVAMVFGEGRFQIALPSAYKEAYDGIISRLKQLGGEEKEAAKLKDSEIKASSLVILGQSNPLVERLYGTIDGMKGGFDVAVRKNPWNARKAVMVINARSSGEAEAAFPALSRYGMFSSLSFKRGKIVSKKEGVSQRGLKMDLRQPAAAIDLSELKTLDHAIGKAAGKKIIYIGEYHDRYAHHAVQLEVIESLHRMNPKLAIGMEMFQRPFQKAVDDYISGAIDERTFLQKTEYFKRWTFDYNLYKPIIDFAREKKIPVIALNQRKEITEKVSGKGLDSLTDEERKEVPEQMDFSDDEYRGRLKKIFDQHRGSGKKNFDFFYQAQVLWDETMAISIDEFLKKQPDYRMVVIAGGGHLAYGSGIPKRAFRRNSLPYFIILNDGEADPEIADYLILPEPLEGIAAPKLMAMLKTENNRVRVMNLPEDSVAKKAGIKTGDTILSIGKEDVDSVEDIRLFLFSTQPGETVKVTVLRERMFLRDKKIEFDVVL